MKEVTSFKDESVVGRPLRVPLNSPVFTSGCWKTGSRIVSKGKDSEHAKLGLLKGLEMDLCRECCSTYKWINEFLKLFAFLVDKMSKAKPI